MNQNYVLNYGEYTTVFENLYHLFDFVAWDVLINSS